MKYYRINLRFLSGLSSLITGDTLWGHLMWMYAYNYGVNKLKQLLADQVKSPLLVSDLFPENYLPVPQLPRESLLSIITRYDNQLDPEITIRLKKISKSRLIPREHFLRIRSQLSSEKLSDVWVEMVSNNSNNSIFGYSVINVLQFHNSIDRHNLSVLKGSLFQNNVQFQHPNSVFNFYVGTDNIDESVLNILLNSLADFGIGADHGIGNGRFELLAISREQELFSLENANAFMSISPFVPCENTPSKGFWKYFTKFGKIGEGVNSNPFKKPIILSISGSVFITQSHPREYYGYILEDIADDPDVMHYALAFPVPVKIEEGL